MTITYRSLGHPLFLLKKSREISLQILQQGLDYVLIDKLRDMILNKVYNASIILQVIVPSKEHSTVQILKNYRKIYFNINTATSYRFIYLFFLNVSETNYI